MRYPDNTLKIISATFSSCDDSGRRTNAAAPSKAPADSEIKIQSFLWFNFMKNVVVAPNRAETRAKNDLSKIKRTIMTKIIF